MKSIRNKLLDKAAQEILQHGFQGSRVDEILNKVGVAKGALYHHFKDKTNLGYAVVDEVIYTLTMELWVKPLADYSDPIEALSDMIHGISVNPPKKVIENGCPLNNVAQEMSSVDEGFRQRTENIYNLWRKAVSDALKRGQENNIVKKSINTDHTAIFIVAAIAGCIGTAKNARSKQLLKDSGETLVGYLESLREN